MTGVLGDQAFKGVCEGSKNQSWKRRRERLEARQRASNGRKHGCAEQKPPEGEEIPLEEIPLEAIPQRSSGRLRRRPTPAGATESEVTGLRNEQCLTNLAISSPGKRRDILVFI